MAELIVGDCIEELDLYPDNWFDSIITDPPYHLTTITKRFGKPDAAPAKHGSDGAFARASKGFMGKCYHPETQVLTRRGWLAVPEVLVGDVVATLRREDEVLEWLIVEQAHEYPFCGNLVAISHRSAAQRVTPNHNVLHAKTGSVALKFSRADGLPRSFHLSAQARPQVGRTDDVVVDVVREYGAARTPKREIRRFPAAAFFRFLGLYLGDGYFSNRKSDHPANDFLGISVKKPRKVSAVRDALTALGVRYAESLHEGRTSFYIYDFALLGYCRELGKAGEKYIPKDLFAWDASILEHLYSGLMDTDGCRQRKDQEVYFTSSPRLADDFQVLCLLTGRSASIKFRPPRKSEFQNGRGGFVCCVLRPGKKLYGENSDRRGNVVSRVPYDGYVYCVGVGKNHTLYTRFDGKPVWSGNSWDGGDIAQSPALWSQLFRVLKPGGYVAAFSSPRTGHRMACAMEDAGFIMHPFIGWAYGSGMPKATNPDKALAARGADPDEWAGWRHGTQAQKPALEPIYVGQKPISEPTMADNLLKWGVGCVNIDACRVPIDLAADASQLRAMNRGPRADASNGHEWGLSRGKADTPEVVRPDGRWPANLMHDGSDEVLALFPDAPGQLARESSSSSSRKNQNVYGAMARGSNGREPREDAATSAARFFYCAKPSKAEKGGTTHPTVKPLALMRWLCRHFTPPGGKILDPFAGSGTTGRAALDEGFTITLIEKEPAHAAEIAARVPEVENVV